MLDILQSDYERLSDRVIALELSQLQYDYERIGERIVALESRIPVLFGDPDWTIPIKHRRYNEQATMLEDMHGTNPQGMTTWDANSKAVKIELPNANGSLTGQLRFRFNDGGASRLEVSLQVMHGLDWSNSGKAGIMPNHKSLQLAIAGSPISDQRFTTRDRYFVTPQDDGAIGYVDVRDVASVGLQPKGPADALRTPLDGKYNTYRRKPGLWYLYQWAVDYLDDARLFSLSITEQGGSPVKIYDQQDLPNWNRVNSGTEYNLIAHINEFWVEYNSSEGAKFAGPGTIFVRNLQVAF